MKPLNKSYLRLGWVLLTNGVLAFLLLTGPVRVHHEQQLLYQAMRTTPPTSCTGKTFSRFPGCQSWR